MTGLLRNFQFALRQLRRSPGFTLTAAATLALGLGATAAVVSVVETVLLAPLPYPEPDRLVGLAFTFPKEKPNAEQAGSSADFVRQSSGEFSSVAVIDDSAAAVNLSVGGGRAVQINSMRVSEGYFRTLGVMPALGRAFTPNEDTPGGGRSAILSDGLWTREFGRDPSVVGRALRVNQETFTVVGVMPAAFSTTAETAPGVLGVPDLWQPLQLSPKDPGYDGDNYEMIGRLRDGVTIEQAQQQLSRMNEPFYAQNPTYRRWTSNSHDLHAFRIWKLQDVVVGRVRRSLLTVMGAVLALLLVACLNLAGLMMARTMRRARELAARSALGATRSQLMRLLGAEGLLLGLGGGLLALLVTRILAHLLLRSAPLPIPVLRGEPGWGLMAATVLGLSMMATGIFSLLPAGFILFNRGREAKLAGPSLGETVSHARLSRVLLMAQVALAMVLVSTGSILMGTFVKLRTIPSGIEPKQLTVFQVALKGDKYANTQHTAQFVSSVLDQLRHTPGVDRVAAINGLPLDRGLNMGAYPAGRDQLRQTVEFRPITSSYLETMGMHLVAGRDLADSDRAGGEPVVMIGATAAKKWWPGQSPIGQSIHIGGEQNWRVVGVVADARMHSLVETQGVVIYAPMGQLSDAFTGIVNNWFPTTFAVRTAAHVSLGDAALQAVERADPEIPVARMTTMQAVIDSTIEEPRFLSLLAIGFSGFALALTVIGLFGLLSYQVTQKTREIGLRMALGADRKNILASFLGRGVAVAAVGLAAGTLALWMVHPVVNELLQDAGIDAANSAQAVVMNGVQAGLLASLAIIVATVAASWLPARRAASVEPMEALRAE
jgi:predicted permease